MNHFFRFAAGTFSVALYTMVIEVPHLWLRALLLLILTYLLGWAVYRSIDNLTSENP